VILPCALPDGPARDPAAVGTDANRRPGSTPVPAMEIELRDAVPTDAACLIELRRTIFGESDFMLYAPDEYADSTDAMAKRIEEISQSSGSRLIVALADKVPAGFLSVTGSEIPRRRHVGYVVIGVVRAHWSRGMGEALLTEALRWAPTAGITRLELGVMTENARAIRLYERLGFRVEGTRKGAYLIGGKPVDEHFMACLIET